MCAEPITDDHRHVVDIQSRQLMCTCRGCGLLFTADAANQRYRAVPDRYLSFPDFELTEAELGRLSTFRSDWPSSSPTPCWDEWWPSIQAPPA